MPELEEARPPRVGLAVVTYVVTLLGGIALIRVLEPGLVVSLLVLAVPAGALGWMIVQARRAQRFRGGGPCGSRAYQRRVIALAVAYVALLFLANWLYDRFALDGALAVAVALLPALPLIGLIVALGRLIVEEQDEYQRMLHVRQMLVATGFMLAICTVWGFLEQFGQVPHVPAYWAFVLWCGGLGFGTMYNEMRA